MRNIASMKFLLKLAFQLQFVITDSEVEGKNAFYAASLQHYEKNHVTANALRRLLFETGSARQHIKIGFSDVRNSFSPIPSIRFWGAVQG